MIDVLIVLAALAVALAFGAHEQRRIRRLERTDPESHTHD